MRNETIRYDREQCVPRVNGSRLPQTIKRRPEEEKVTDLTLFYPAIITNVRPYGAFCKLSLLDEHPEVFIPSKLVKTVSLNRGDRVSVLLAENRLENITAETPCKYHAVELRVNL
jgi:hypothetical protein